MKKIEIFVLLTILFFGIIAIVYAEKRYEVRSKNKDNTEYKCCYVDTITTKNKGELFLGFIIPSASNEKEFYEKYFQLKCGSERCDDPDLVFKQNQKLNKIKCFELLTPKKGLEGKPALEEGCCPGLEKGSDGICKKPEKGWLLNFLSFFKKR